MEVYFQYTGPTWYYQHTMGAIHVRTRIAPSPTGENLHIGNAYTALINYVFARQQHGEFIVRIEDTDRTRLVEGSEKRILESLDWLGLKPDESPLAGGQFKPYRQSERLDTYKKYAEELVSAGHAYYCFCTPQRLEQMRKGQEAEHKAPMYDGLCKKIDPEEAKKRVMGGEKHVIRLNVPDEGTTKFNDLIRGEISFENKLIDDQVLMKSDGFPTYHLGVVVDDHLMEISHIIRGEEWISSTPKHILLYGFFGWGLPIFAHMPLLRNPDKSKLSKRKNPVWVSWYKDQGFLPEALINYLGTMAWAFSDGRDIFSLKEMTREFRLENVKTTAPIFDIEKLKWMNKQYLMKTSPSEFKALVSTVSVYSGTPQFNTIAVETASLIQPRIETTLQYDSIAGFFYQRPAKYERPIKKELIEIVIHALKDVPWEHEKMEQAIRQTAEKSNVTPKDLFMELRVAVTGKTVGPPILESLMILGREETLARLTV